MGWSDMVKAGRLLKERAPWPYAEGADGHSYK